MKFFDLELGGLGAASISYTKLNDAGICVTVKYTNGTSEMSCGLDSQPGQVSYGKKTSVPCAKSSVTSKFKIR
jgi:hypothetical protein